MGKKATNAEIELRINTIYKMIVKNTSYRDILRYASEKWGVSTRNTDIYIQRAKERIKADFVTDKEQLKAEYDASMNDLFVKMYQREDFRGCLSVIESKRKMHGTDDNVINGEISEIIKPNIIFNIKTRNSK